MTDAFIYDAVRSPRGKGRADGSLHELTSVALSAKILNAVKERNGLTGHAVEDVIWGNVTQVGEQGGCLARSAVLLSDLAGCGDSSGDFADASWDLWLEDINQAARWMTARYASAPLWIWGLRSGCLLAAQAGRLLVLDVGSGFNTPSVVRWPAEQIVARHPNADLVRVNRFRPEVPAQPTGRTLGLACDGSALWAALATSQAK